MEKTNEKLVLYSLAYGTNISYIIIITMIGVLLEESLGLVTPLIAIIGATTVTMIISRAILVKKDRDGMPIERTILYLAAAHSVSLIGLVIALMTII